MPEGLAAAFATPGLPFLALAVLVAGLVRGFSGFGAALIMMPVAAAIMPLPVAIVMMAVVGVLSWPVLLPRALREADRSEAAILGLAALVTAPLGTWVLTAVPQEVLRWTLATIASATLLALLSGLRYRGRVSRPGVAAVGGAVGLMGGATGLSGPPAVLFYLAGQARAPAIRANVIVAFAIFEIGVIASLFARDLVTMRAIWLGLAMALPYLLGSTVGQMLFRPEREREFRLAAYVTIALAILSSLPVFD
ncbi:TSUP family transporter [Pseudooceanicola sp. 216_PA32_1]|uniref:Probable membrane transporter protein n=1 Tax=Pseudooceanicola pacificus TaxID=2676438 RepID=A0A844WBJ9_9RHOB|nr:sulfite exporter TauE/SafE family protein [Pseudooceanicola pacificus]MWB78553.1 TSUP family transporter [Pseudooceanicola pacificus]